MRGKNGLENTALKIPEAKEAVNQEWEKLENISAWDLMKAIIIWLTNLFLCLML